MKKYDGLQISIVIVYSVSAILLMFMPYSKQYIATKEESDTISFESELDNAFIDMGIVEDVPNEEDNELGEDEFDFASEYAEMTLEEELGVNFDEVGIDGNNLLETESTVEQTAQRNLGYKSIFNWVLMIYFGRLIMHVFGYEIFNLYPHLVGLGITYIGSVYIKYLSTGWFKTELVWLGIIIPFVVLLILTILLLVDRMLYTIERRDDQFV